MGACVGAGGAVSSRAAHSGHRRLLSFVSFLQQNDKPRILFVTEAPYWRSAFCRSADLSVGSPRPVEFAAIVALVTRALRCLVNSCIQAFVIVEVVLVIFA